jgi:hypothetical protein
MIIFAFIALGLVSYNTIVDKPLSNTKTTKEVYEAKKKERQ